MGIVGVPDQVVVADKVDNGVEAGLVRVGQDPEPELGETLQYAGENKVRHGHHVVHRKPDDMVESAERALISLERTKGRGPYMARLAMYGDGKIEIAGKLPQGIVFGFVQPFARGQ